MRPPSEGARNADAPVGTEIPARVFKVLLRTGEIETLITDWTPVELPQAVAPALYFMRWGIETHDDMKSTICIENFSGRTPIVVEQDYYAAIFLAKMFEMIEADGQEKGSPTASASIPP